jgi:aminopeptidase N
MLRGGKCFHG